MGGDGSDGRAEKSRGEVVASLIRSRVFDGTLRPGERVPQDEIARETGVSRIPVREAVIALEREGWVRVEMHRGAFVNALDAAVVIDCYDLYSLAYGFAVHKLLERAAPETVERVLALGERVRAAPQPDEVTRKTVAFNAAVVAGTGSGRIDVLLRSMTGLLPGHLSTPQAVADLEQRGIAGVADCIRREDAEGATLAYEQMFDAIAGQVVTMLAERGLITDAGALAPTLTTEERSV